MSFFFTDNYFGSANSTQIAGNDLISTYNASLSSSAQGQLASTYTATLAAALSSAEVADHVAFLVFQTSGDVDTALSVKASIQAGNFTLTDLFGAAQSKTGAVLGSAITNPLPKMVVNEMTIDLSGVLRGLDTESWVATALVGKKTEITYHTREFFTATQQPTNYDPDWAVQNEPPVAEAISINLIEDTAALPIDLLSTASDPDGDALSIVPGSYTFTVNGTPVAEMPAYLTIADGVVTFDTSYDLLAGEELIVEIGYTISDGNEGAANNTATITYTGTIDTYTDTRSFDFVKVNSSTVGQSAAGFWTVPTSVVPGSLTVSGEADLNGNKETLTVRVDGDQIIFQGSGTPQGGGETLLPYSGTITLQGSDFTDSAIDYSVAFSDQVANGSSVHLEMVFSYMA